MYAIVESGGKQYRVAEGEVIDVEKLSVPEGEKVSLDRVLMVADGGDVRVGTPLVEGARVEATVLDHGKGRKIRIFKYKPKIRYRRRAGHRQQYTRLRIERILV